VKEYHNKFYHLQNLTAIICGETNPKDLIRILNEYPELFHANPTIPKQIIIENLDIITSNNFSTKTIQFPSESLEFGSVAYGFSGPLSKDFKSLVAIDVLLRFLNDNPASLCNQFFVERKSPFCSDVDFEVKGLVVTSIFMIFSGVEYGDKNGDDESEGERSEVSIGCETKSKSTSDASDQDDGESTKMDLFAPGIFYSLLQKCLSDFPASLKRFGGILSAIERQCNKIYEAIEDDPHEFIASSLIPAITRDYYAGFNDGEQDRQYLKNRGDVFEVLQELKKKDADFWIDLCNKYLINGNVCEILMLPDCNLSKSLEEKQVSFILNLR
jgi:Zn-dependent M16 (insulinase) family peptidase